MSLAAALGRSGSALRQAGVRATMRAPAVVVASSRWLSASASDPVISIGELKGLIASPEAKLRLFDVREPHEYAEGKIADAINIPGMSSHALWRRLSLYCSWRVWRRAEARSRDVPEDIRHQQAGQGRAACSGLLQGRGARRPGNAGGTCAGLHDGPQLQGQLARVDQELVTVMCILHAEIIHMPTYHRDGGACSCVNHGGE